MRPTDVPPGPVVVDTDVLSWITWSRGPYRDFEALLSGHVLAISFATVGEMLAGAMKAGWGQRRRQHLDQALAQYAVIPASRTVVERWATLSASLRGQLHGGGANDMWTAACALSQQPVLPVATNNRRDFLRIREVLPFVLVHPDE